MTFSFTLSALANIASAALFVAVALLVLRAAPRDRGNLAFAVAAAGFGTRILAYYALLSSTPDDPWKLPLLLADIAGVVVFTVGLVLLGLWLPRPLRPGERRLLALPAGFALAAVALFWGAYAVGGPDYPLLQGFFRVDASLAPVADAETVLQGPMYAALAFALLALAARAPTLSPREGSQVRILTVALVIWAGLVTGAIALDFPRLDMRISGLAGLAAGVVAAALWLRDAARRPGPEGRASRAVAWVCVGAGLAGLLLARLSGGFPASLAAPQFAVARLLMVLLMAYAVVRHQLFGIDVKVRWTVKQSTIAAVFIGVFFMVSEGAQAFFATETNSEFLGIAAAGLLVFALAPLQRAAERVASAAVPDAGAAVPSAGAAGPAPLAAKAAVYRDAVRLALRDGQVTLEEERVLVCLADEMGLNATRALEIRREVEAERAGEGRAEGREEGKAPA